MVKILAYGFLLLSLLFNPMARAANNPDDNAEGTENSNRIMSQAKEVIGHWEDKRSAGEREFKDLIGKFQDEIHHHEKQLDHGDATTRSRITEEMRDMERQRDDLKKMLAEIKASKVVGISKIPEEIRHKIDDLND